LHGRIFATNDPAFDLVASIPMTEFGCRCRLRGLTERKAEKIAKEMGVDLDKIRSQAKLQGRVKEVQSQSMGANYYELNLGGGRSFRTAVKWRNNPALSFWEERVVRANTQPERNYREVMRSINGGVEVFNAGRPLAVFNTGRMITNFDLTEPDAEEKLFERFIKDNNGSDGLVKVTDPLGKVRVFSKYSFTDRSKKPPESKIAKRGRHRFLNYMPEVVNDPDLIIVKNAVRGMPARTMYIKGYMDGRFIRGLVVVVDGQNVHQVVTAYSVNTKGNFPKIKKGEDWHSQKSPIGLDIKSILGDIVEKAKRGQDVEFELIYPENIDLLK
jgi:hypothetical protein